MGKGESLIRSATVYEDGVTVGQLFMVFIYNDISAISALLMA